MVRANELIRLIGEVLDLDTWTVEPGLPDPSDFVNRCVIVTPYGGPGTDVDGIVDAVSWQVRVMGDQNDYESAEDAAYAIDTFFQRWFSGRIPQPEDHPTPARWLVSIQRVGGAPSALVKDNAERTHFVCSYIFATEQPALVNNQ